MPHQLATIDKIKTGVNQNEFFIRYDLSGYYDKIPHDKLIEILSDKIDDDYFIQLIRHSINNHIDKNIQAKRGILGQEEYLKDYRSPTYLLIFTVVK